MKKLSKFFGGLLFVVGCGLIFIFGGAMFAMIIGAIMIFITILVICIACGLPITVTLENGEKYEVRRFQWNRIK